MLGVSSQIASIGTVPLSPSIGIENVLFLPSLNCNLLSVQTLTKSHNISCTFFPTHCIFQDLHTKVKNGSGTGREGLYYLEGAFNFPAKGKLMWYKKILLTRKKKKSTYGVDNWDIHHIFI